jgi:hypothetical protein
VTGVQLKIAYGKGSYVVVVVVHCRSLRRNLSVTLVHRCWRVESLVAVVSRKVFVRAWPVINALPVPCVRVLDHLWIVFAVGVVGGHFDLAVARL